MKKYFLVILFVAVSELLFSQGKFERRIIIEDSIFYAVEIIGQTGVLWKGNITEPMDSAQKYALPVGTKRRSIHYLPLSWNVHNDTLYAINFTEYAQNERLTSFKSIPLFKLEKYTGQNNAKQLMQGAFENGIIENWPMVNMLKKYKYIDDLFFDFVVTDSGIIQYIVINNELTIWEWKNNKWTSTVMIPFGVQNYFNLYIKDNNIIMLESNGEEICLANKTRITNFFPEGFELKNYLFLENRDDNSFRFIKNIFFENTSLSLTQILLQ